MADLDARLSSSLRRIREVHTDTYWAELPLLREQVLNRVKRRRALLVGATALATAVAAVAALLVVPSSGDRQDFVPPAGDARAFAIWPEFSEDAALMACARRGVTEHWRTTSDGVANRFVIAVIGWSKAAITELPSATGRLERWGWTKVVRGLKGKEAHVAITVAPVPGTECWSVVSADSPSAKTSLSFDEGSLSVDIEPSLPFDWMEVEIVQEGRAAISNRFEATALPIEMSGYQEGAPGYLLITLERRGRTVWAYGRALP